MEIIPIQPQFGVNYRPGDIFWCMTHDTVGDAIAFFERTESQGIAVDHTGIITGEDECVQAHIQNGVQMGKLSDYWNDPKNVMYIRTPNGLNDDLAARIVKEGEAHIGAKYGTAEIGGMILADTELGKLLNGWLKNEPEHWVNRMLDNPRAFICSKLVATALNAQSEFQGKGILAKASYEIDPQQLFDDVVIFPATGTRAVHKAA